MIFSDDLIKLATETLDLARQADMKIATVESCTGGLIGALLTEIAGSSDVFERGFTTYSNEAKIELVGVDQDTLTQHGAVSEQVAHEMALGGLKQSKAQLVIAVTGVAGPGGGSAEKPVGLVHIALGAAVGLFPKIVAHEAYQFGDIGRSEVRMATVKASLEMIKSQLEVFG